MNRSAKDDHQESEYTTSAVCDHNDNNSSQLRWTRIMCSPSAPPRPVQRQLTDDRWAAHHGSTAATPPSHPNRDLSWLTELVIDDPAAAPSKSSIHNAAGGSPKRTKKKLPSSASEPKRSSPGRISSHPDL